MRFFSKLYGRMLKWSAHPHAPYYLSGVSVAESMVFPLPPDVMLASMSLAKPSKALRYALLATVSSVLGGVLGYLIGLYFVDLVQWYAEAMGQAQRFLEFKEWYHAYGFWVVFIGGFSPIPYKIVTVGSGLVGVNFLIFLFASLVSRGLRFFMVSIFIQWGGEPLKEKLHQYIDLLGWIFVILSILVYFFYFK